MGQTEERSAAEWRAETDKLAGELATIKESMTEQEQRLAAFRQTCGIDDEDLEGELRPADLPDDERRRFEELENELHRQEQDLAAVDEAGGGKLPRRPRRLV